jgi:hypothetical protein
MVIRSNHLTQRSSSTSPSNDQRSPPDPISIKKGDCHLCGALPKRSEGSKDDSHLALLNTFKVGYLLNCVSYNWAYNPPSASSSAWVPRSTIYPRSMTRIRSAARMVLSFLWSHISPPSSTLMDLLEWQYVPYPKAGSVQHETEQKRLFGRNLPWQSFEENPPLHQTDNNLSDQGPNNR